MTKPLTTDQLRVEISHRASVYSNARFKEDVDAMRNQLDAIMAAVKDHVDEVIGEDEPIAKGAKTYVGRYETLIRNRLKSEQRNKAGPY